MLARIMDVALIVNPYASEVTQERVHSIERELARGAEVTTLLTERPGHGAELAAGVGDADAIVVFSGDGGFNEALNGFDAELIRRVDRLGRRDDGRRPGDLAFIVEAATFVGRRLGRFEPALEVGGLGRAAFALVANTDPYSYAGPRPIHVAQEARFELGLDVVAPARVTPLTVPRLVRHILRGEREDSVLYGHDLDRIEVSCDRPLPLQADGEDLGDVSDAVFEAERSAVRVLI